MIIKISSTMQACHCPRDISVNVWSHGQRDIALYLIGKNKSYHQIIGINPCHAECVSKEHIFLHVTLSTIAHNWDGADNVECVLRALELHGDNDRALEFQNEWRKKRFVWRVYVCSKTVLRPSHRPPQPKNTTPPISQWCYTTAVMGTYLPIRRCYLSE